MLAEPRRVRIGFRIALAGAVLLALFGIQAIVEVARTGEVPENFVLFGLGFLLAVFEAAWVALGIALLRFHDSQPTGVALPA